MIPFQELRNRRGEPIPFFQWVSSGEIPVETLAPFPETRDQLADWLAHLFPAFGLALPVTPEAFREAAKQPDALIVRLPHAYVQCRDRPGTYLRFAPIAWLESLGLSQGGALCEKKSSAP